jgi:prephenate dehydrogenase
VHFVGSHPMAGSHETGVAHARADLLQDACCVVTDPGAGAADAAGRVAAFWQALGARVVRREPDAHDAEVAWVSHLPHLLAFAYARALERAPEGAAELAGSGFRDFVRIARSDGELWSDILGLNRKALAGPLRAFSEALEELAGAFESGEPEALAAGERLLTAARRHLDSVLHHNSLAKQGVTSHTGARPKSNSARSGGENPEIQAAQETAATRSINQDS